MTNKELDELDRYLAEKVMEVSHIPDPEGDLYGIGRRWSPTRNIADAMEVAEKLEKWEIGRWDNVYLCTFRGYQEDEDVWYECGDLNLAICLAAKQAIEATEKEPA